MTRFSLVPAFVIAGLLAGCTAAPRADSHGTYPRFLRVKWGAPVNWQDRLKWLTDTCGSENPCTRAATNENLGDVAPGHPKMLAVSWACGTREVRAANVREGDFLIAECPAPAAGTADMSIESAHFGGGNVLDEVRQACTGKVLPEPVRLRPTRAWSPRCAADVIYWKNRHVRKSLEVELLYPYRMRHRMRGRYH